MTGTPGGKCDIGGVEIVTLGAADVPAMMALTELTKPGPFMRARMNWGRFSGSGSMANWSRWRASE